MVAEAEKFAEEDEAQRKRIEALNSLSSFVYGLKTQLGDQEGLGGKVSDEDKKTILAAVKDTTDWIDENGSSASVEDLEEKLAGMYPFYLPSSINTNVCFVGQRYKVSSTPSPANSTQTAAHQVGTPMMMSLRVIMTSSEWLDEGGISYKEWTC